MKFAFMTLACPDWELATVPVRAAEYGFDGVELRVWGDRHVDPAMTPEQRAACRERFAANGVAICGLASYATFNGLTTETLEANAKKLRDAIDLAADLGAPVVRAFVGDKPEELPWKQAFAQAARYLDDGMDYANLRGVTVAVETHDDYCKLPVLQELLGGMRHAPSLVWDMQNTFNVGQPGAPLIEAFGMAAIKHVHIRDAKTDGQLVLTGQGDMPLHANLDLLIANDYKGYVSLEWEKTWQPQLEEPEVALPHFLAYVGAYR